jgi:hypothetical protein
MKTWMLAAGAAALAMTAPALAERGGGHGGGHGGGGQAKAERGDRGSRERAPRVVEQRNDRSMGRDDRGGDRVEKMRGRERQAERIVVRSDDRRGDNKGDRGKDLVKAANGQDVGRPLVRRFADNDRFYPGRGLVNNCPPGLAKKDNGCLPPGQASKLIGAPLQANFAKALVPYQYRSWYRDNDDYYYRYGDDYIYRIGRQNNLVDGLIPLFGTGYYMVGDPWPQPYNFYNVPYQYRSYWPDSDDYYYRYGDGAIYQLDAKSQAVNAIVALLAGDIGVGSRLPMGYDVYNVPFAYRDRYYDTPDAWYRYNDGYIYRVDPTTRLVTAVIDAII